MKKGFTLVELLAIVIIAGTISIVSFAAITNTIKNNQIRETENFESSIIGATQLYVSANQEKFQLLDRTGSSVEVTTQELIDNGYLKKKMNNPTNIVIERYYVLVIKNPQGYLDYILGNDENVPEIPKYKYFEAELNGSDPALLAGYIPIYYDSNTPKVADLSTEWYNYKNKKWANAVLIKSDRRGYYANASGGTAVEEEDILAYFVWVPRFKFKILTLSTTTTQSTLDIIFEPRSAKSSSTSIGEYRTHPGFTFGNSEVSGIWVGKFETTGTASDITVKPNIPPLVGINLADSYLATDSMGYEKYGINNKARVAKSTEWMAAAYLATSKYGVDGRVRPNNFELSNEELKTGCGSPAGATGVSTTCTDQYGTKPTYPQSTTGNITGIFDMTAGAWENTMTFTLNSSEEVLVGINESDNSGFEGKLTNGSANTGAALPPKAYYEVIEPGSVSTLCSSKRYLGFSFCMTSGWFNGYENISDGPILQVSGGPNVISQSSQFTHCGYTGIVDMQDSFRTVMVNE